MTHITLPTPGAPGWQGTVASVAGRTGNIELTKADVGLGNVDNTADADKPISTATAAALSGKMTIIDEFDEGVLA